MYAIPPYLCCFVLSTGKACVADSTYLEMKTYCVCFITDWNFCDNCRLCFQHNVELAIKNQGAIIIFQVHHHDFRGKQILITFSKALIKFAIDMLYYYFF